MIINFPRQFVERKNFIRFPKRVLCLRDQRLARNNSLQRQQFSGTNKAKMIWQREKSTKASFESLKTHSLTHSLPLLSHCRQRKTWTGCTWNNICGSEATLWSPVSGCNRAFSATFRRREAERQFPRSREARRPNRATVLSVARNVRETSKPLEGRKPFASGTLEPSATTLREFSRWICRFRRLFRRLAKSFSPVIGPAGVEPVCRFKRRKRRNTGVRGRERKRERETRTVLSVSGKSSARLNRNERRESRRLLLVGYFARGDVGELSSASACQRSRKRRRWRDPGDESVPRRRCFAMPAQTD